MDFVFVDVPHLGGWSNAFAPGLVTIIVIIRLASWPEGYTAGPGQVMALKEKDMELVTAAWAHGAPVVGRLPARRLRPLPC